MQSLTVNGPLLITLQHFPYRMGLPPLLNLCTEVKAWGVAAQICGDRSLYPQAFYYHLKELGRTYDRDKDDKEELQNSTAIAAKYYLRYMLLYI